jgi:hypothetical protein
VLDKGLNFIPTPRKDHAARIIQDFLLFDRKLRLKYFFHHDITDEDAPPQNVPRYTESSTTLKPSTG